MELLKRMFSNLFRDIKVAVVVLSVSRRIENTKTHLISTVKVIVKEVGSPKVELVLSF